MRGRQVWKRTGERTLEHAPQVKVAPPCEDGLELRVRDDTQDLQVQVVEVDAELHSGVRTASLRISAGPRAETREGSEGRTTLSGSPSELTATRYSGGLRRNEMRVVPASMDLLVCPRGKSASCQRRWTGSASASGEYPPGRHRC